MAILSQFDQNLTFKNCLKSIGYLIPFGWSGLRVGHNHQQLEYELRNFYSNNKIEAVFFDSGRSALYAILKILQHEVERKEVIVSAYTCIVVINSILKAGLTPIYVDTNKNDLSFNQDDLELKINRNTLAIIVQNTFGFPDHYNQIKASIKGFSVYIIEDLAQSLGAQYHSEKIGLLGDVAFLSFGSGKIISSSRGGAAITTNEELSLKLQEFKNELPFQSIFEILRHHHKICKFYLAGRASYYFLFGRFILWLASKLRLFPKIITQAEKLGELDQIKCYQYANSLASIARDQLATLPETLDHRDKIAKIYSDGLENNPKILTLPYDVDSAYMCFPIFIKNPVELFKKLKAKNILLNLEWSFTNIVPYDIDNSKTGYIKGSCPNAEFFGATHLALPTHIHISEKKAYNLVTELLKVL